MTGPQLTRIRIAWGSKRALARLLGCSPHMIRSNEARRYVTYRMGVLMSGRRAAHALRIAASYWAADDKIKRAKAQRGKR